jgi:hypothetical protein
MLRDAGASPQGASLREAIVTQVDRKSHLMTDEAGVYTKTGEEFAGHSTVTRSDARLHLRHITKREAPQSASILLETLGQDEGFLRPSSHAMKISHHSRGDAAQIVEEKCQLIRQQKGESVEARLMGVPPRNEPQRRPPERQFLKRQHAEDPVRRLSNWRIVEAVDQSARPRSRTHPLA